jgi:hypothetical protein
MITFNSSALLVMTISQQGDLIDSQRKDVPGRRDGRGSDSSRALSTHGAGDSTMVDLSNKRMTITNPVKF